MTTQNLLLELLVEELPPKALKKLGEAFGDVLAQSLKAQGLTREDAVVTHYASPRRLAVHVTAVAPRAQDKVVLQKLMPVTVGLDASGGATPALLKRLQALGADGSAVPGLKRSLDGKSEALFYESVVPGASLASGLQKALDDAINRLPIPRLMSYQLEADCALPGWSSVSFVRPAHGLVALHGNDVVNVQALGLTAGNSTQGHRFEARVSPLVISSADGYAAALAQDGAVIASFAERRAEIARQLAAAAAKVGDGSHPIDDDMLLDEVTGLVERPNVLLCGFEEEFLEVPQECLILTMKANQKYFPLLDAQGKLTNRFLVVSNISPADSSAVIVGNERVVRPRLADAKFFFDQDRKKTLRSRMGGLSKVVYHNRLGSQGDRMERVRAMARDIGHQAFGSSVGENADAAAMLAKVDLLTDMVGEFPELQGVMGGYYARHDGESDDVALAIEDHYKPRFAGDTLPRNREGLALALADKMETLVGMFAIGNLPTGDKDPYALRRHALGVVRILIDEAVPIDWDWLVTCASRPFDALSSGWTADQQTAFASNVVKLTDFVYERLSGSLREQGFSAQEVDAVLALRSQQLREIPKRLDAVRAFASLPEAPALAAANKRIANILKKAESVHPHASEILLQEPAEKALYFAMQSIAARADVQFAAGDYTASLQTLAALRAPVDDFFDSVMVNAEQADLRLNRQGLLKSLHNAMNQVADLSKLAS